MVVVVVVVVMIRTGLTSFGSVTSTTTTSRFGVLWYCCVIHCSGVRRGGGVHQCLLLLLRTSLDSCRIAAATPTSTSTTTMTTALKQRDTLGGGAGAGGPLVAQLRLHDPLRRHVDLVVHEDHQRQGNVEGAQRPVQLVPHILRDLAGGRLRGAVLVADQQHRRNGDQTGGDPDGGDEGENAPGGPPDAVRQRLGDRQVAV